MTRLVASTLALIVTIAVSVPPTRAQQSEVNAEDVVAALETAYGVHPGERRNHAKGTCAVGTFVGMAEAAAYSRSALFAGQPVPVVARFSLAGGDPHASDTDRSPRGMALEFRLPNGSLQLMTMINTPMFFAAMPRTFLDKMLALKPDPATGKPNPEALKAFAESHPDTKSQATFLATNNVVIPIVPTPAFTLSSSLTGTTKSLWCGRASFPRTEKNNFPCGDDLRAHRLS